MSVVDRIRAARRAHEALRAEPLTAVNKEIKAVFDELGAAADKSLVAAGAAEVRRATRLLTIDAEHYAGLNDSEGFRNPADAWGQYELLERAFGG